MNDDPRFLRLPKWAQGEITRLTADVEWWKDKATPQIANSNTGVKHGYDAIQCLGDSPRIEYKTGPDWFQVIEAHLVTWGGDEALRISATGGGGLSVLPSASNSIYVKLVKP